MKIVPLDQLDIGAVITMLKLGKTIVYPTETCYGLGCDATNNAAVEQIFDIKKRQREKSMLMLVQDVQMAKEYVVWNEQIQRLADTYWPGPLTIVAEKNPDAYLASGLIHEQDHTVAFRIANHPVAQAIIEALQKPIVSTSANISAAANPYDIATILSMYTAVEPKPDLLIDAGSLPQRSSSTIVKITQGEVVVLRQGELVVS